MLLVEGTYRQEREVRGDLIVARGSKSPVFVHIGPTEGEEGYSPKQGFFVFPDEQPEILIDKKNLIVNSASLIMSQRMQPGTSGMAAGINALAVGTGVGTGTTQNPQAPDPTLTGLRAEAYRTLISSWTFLDANGNPTSSATNTLQITTNIAGSSAVPSGSTSVSLTEMGLFAGNASTAASCTTMYNMVTFAVQNLQNTQTMTVVWTLTF